ncbi:beta-ketoacyl synthase N-terminal-like domain-containing protein [Lentzea sp. NPDC051213]|uniref:beta-ketoacyl synthase N-terminal-like domain-containing protein n=1 Tax=Lentzea sp. NPDC051213 TaxID=3364126 RepID=UPI0037BB5936
MSTDPDLNAVAVIGLACRFGPADSARALWELLAGGGTGIRRYSDDELIALGHRPETLRRSGFVPAGSVLADADAFDAEVFGYSPQHAEWLEPQQRLLLETSWHALEDAGIAPRGSELRTGVWMSVGQPTTPPLEITDLDAAGMIRFSSTDKDFAATRVSYQLGLTGPSMTVQTACSSSLVGVHLATESLLNEECDAAVVGGASLHFPQAGYVASRDMILSPSGECRPFDDTADGTVFGNGVGVVVLRRLADAIAEGDPIRAVIRGSAINNDGGRKMDFHAPSPEGQEAVIREALLLAGIDPATVGYVEAHGTGTHLGDPIEFAALARVYPRGHVGSVKNVVGHTNTAAGVAGLIKAVLLLEHGTVPAQQGFQAPNARLSAGGLSVGVGSSSWPVADGPRRAAVSSFGIGGTNAHVVLEQAPPVVLGTSSGPQVVALSARTPAAVEELAGRVADALDGADFALDDVAATLSGGRVHERSRLAVVAEDVPGLVAALRAGAGVRGTAAPVRRGDTRAVLPASADLEATAQAWVDGVGELPVVSGRRVRLPGYPFARRRWPRAGELGVEVLPADPVVADHVVAGDPVLPAAAQLDLALKAAGPAVTALTDVTFHQPVRVTDRTRLQVVVDGERVRISSDVLHFEATVSAAGPVVAEVAPRVTETVSPAALYKLFADNGVAYGPSFQVIEELTRGQEGAVAVIAGSLGADHRVSPYVLDGVLQTVIGCLSGDDLGGETFIPFALGRVEVFGAVPGRIRVHVRPVALAGGGKRIRKFTLTATDSDGTVVLRLTDLALRPIARAAVSLPGDAVHLFVPATVAQPRIAAEAVVLVDGTDAQAAALAEVFGTVLREVPVADAPPLIVWPLPDGAPEQQAADAVVFLKPLLKSLSRTGARIVVPYAPGSLAGPGIAAMGRSLRAENPRFELVAVEHTGHFGQDVASARKTVLRPLRITSQGNAFVRGGRYWINGMGALAEAIAAHLLSSYQAHVVLTGRSATSDRAAALAGLGGSVEYHQVDCTDERAVREFVAAMEPVRGVLHCAGVLRDSFLLRKDPGTVAEVVGPKLRGALVLDEATAHWQLDHFVVFSSVSGVLGSPGQADYAFANAAADEFARQRTRSGRTLSIAWPYWADGGMGGEVEEVLGSFGMRPLSTVDGVAVLESLLAADSPVDPVVLCGDLERIQESFPVFEEAEEPVVEAQPLSGGRAGLESRLAAVVAEATRTPVAEVRADRYFEDLGIDSLLVVRIVELLEADFGPLSKTLLFECQTVAELADYFLAEHPSRCAELTGAVVETPVEPEVVVSAVSSADEADPRAIAIIGVAGRYPEGEEPAEFWQTLLAGKDCVTEVPRDRWDAEAMYDADRTRVDRTYTKWGSFLDGVQDFDAPLFNISPREASVIDPQSRLFMESCWSVLEDAGYRPDEVVTSADPIYKRDVGVFVGAMYGEYQLHEAEERLQGNPILANSAYWSIANRVSYFFNFQGPSVAVDTACSSALTAIHLACESLRAGSCKVAIAGGVNVLIHPNKYFMLGQGKFAAGDGRCRSFGAGGDGYVPGEGVGSVLLKPLAAALADGDYIHGVIRGTSANHGGRTNGYTVPNPRAQADLITKALRDGGLDASAIDYVEAHGTGTSLGDPIEVRGLTTAFARDGVTSGAVPIGSVKSNLGHLESAAGAVALHKVLLQLQHRTLVPSIHATPANPEIDFAATPFAVQQSVAPWESRSGGPLRAGISSFGAGGANAHIVVEQAPARLPRTGGGGPVTVFLSARTDAALAAYARSLRDHVVAFSPDLVDVAYTFAVGRVDLPRRCAIPARDLAELVAGLEKVASGSVPAAWVLDGPVDRMAGCGAAGGRRIPLPHYPFERVRCWYDLQIRHLDPERDPVERGHLRDFGKSASPAAPTKQVVLAAPAAPVKPAAPLAPAEPVVAAAPVGRASFEQALLAASGMLVCPSLSLDPGPAIGLRHPNTNRQKGESMPRSSKISLRVLEKPGPSPVRETAPQVAPAAPVAAPAGPIDSVLTEMLSSVLYLGPGELDPERSFQDLGVDSILGVEFVRAVNGRFGLEVKATSLYDHPTPASFAGYVSGLAGGTPAPAPAPAPAAPDRTREITTTLRAQLAEVLYSTEDEVDVARTFNELGVDSILGVELIAFVNRTYQLDVKAGALYDHPTVATLAAHVAGLLTGGPAQPSDVDAVLAAVRDNKLSVDQALALLKETR